MKKLIFIFFLIFSNYYKTNAQDRSLIDNISGFKTIKLNSNSSTFENLIFCSNIITSGEYKGMCFKYEPKDQSLYYFFDSKFDKILLNFDENNLLIKIRLVKYFSKDQDSSSLTDFKQNIVNIIGNFDNNKNNNSEFLYHNRNNNGKTKYMVKTWNGVKTNIVLTTGFVFCEEKTFQDMNFETHFVELLFEKGTKSN